MESNIIQLERVFDAPAAIIWKALTDKDEMKKWYFEFEEFKPEVGFRFTFTGGPDCDTQFVHLCEINEVIPQKKLTYSWAYEGYSGMSHVTFELSAQDNKTLLKLTHVGIDTFPKTNPHLDIANFRAGWDDIVNRSLKAYTETV